MSDKYTVQIGESTFTIQHFRGLKAIMAFAAMTRIAREVPDLMADAVKEYQQRNTVVITENMARLPRWNSFTKEDFDAAEAKTGKREIELPTPMTSNEQMMYALPQLLEKARKEVVRLLALLIVPNSELRDADREGKVPEALDKYEEVLLYDAELDQLADLMFAAQDVLKEQLADRKDRLGKLMTSLWNAWTRNRQQQAQQTYQPPTTDQPSTQPTSLEDVPTSSTDLDEPMDGTETPLSTVSPGKSS